MFKKICTFVLLCMLLAVLPAWGLDLKPGMYEITARVVMKGMPEGMPPQTTTQCLDEQNPVPVSSMAAQGCKITEMKTKGSTVTFTMECTQQGMKLKSTGKMTYKGDSFEGTSQITMGPASGGMTVKTIFKGKRIGKCE